MSNQDKELAVRHEDDAAEVAYWRFDARVKGYSEWKGRPQSERDAFKAEYRQAESRYTARIAELEAEVERLKSEHQWQPIETAPKGKIVLVHYKNCLGNGRTVRAKFYLRVTLESDDSESGYADAGWYEEAEGHEYLSPLESDPTHWMPLPSQPSEAMKGGA
jgi:hypothetical protein